jgi:hypothetical protein
MTALPKEFVTAAHPRTRRGRRALPNRQRTVPIEIGNIDSQSDFEPSDKRPPLELLQKPLPTSLQFLLRFQQASSVLTLGLVGIVLGVYAWTVYTPKAWSHEFHKLQMLQRHERQLVANNESIKHQLAEQAAKPSSGLVNTTPQQNIFLAASPNKLSLSRTKSIQSPTPLRMPNKPIAY